MTPPQAVVDAAVQQAGYSPCRSQRGAVVFVTEAPTIYIKGRGHNRKPYGFACDRSDACKARCRTEAVHAEQHALLNAGHRTAGADLLHVKIVDGALVPSGGPSCVECSKLALAAGIAGVWLYHETGWVRYVADTFHAMSLTGARARERAAREPDRRTINANAAAAVLESERANARASAALEAFKKIATLKGQVEEATLRADAAEAELAQFRSGTEVCEKCHVRYPRALVRIELKDGAPIADPAGFQWCVVCHGARLLAEARENAERWEGDARRFKEEAREARQDAGQEFNRAEALEVRLREAFGKAGQHWVRAERAERERDALRAALDGFRVSGPDPHCWCGVNVGMGSAHAPECVRAATALGVSQQPVGGAPGRGGETRPPDAADAATGPGTPFAGYLACGCVNVQDEQRRCAAHAAAHGLTPAEVFQVMQHWETRPPSLEQTAIVTKLGRLRDALERAEGGCDGQ